MTRLGNFLKFLGTKFQAKVAEMIGNFLGNSEKPQSYPKILVLLFGQLLDTLGLFFTPTSGHTASLNTRRRKNFGFKTWLLVQQESLLFDVTCVA